MEGEHPPTIIQLIRSTDLAVIQFKDSHIYSSYSNSDMATSLVFGTAWYWPVTKVAWEIINQYGSLSICHILRAKKHRVVLLYMVFKQTPILVLKPFVASPIKCHYVISLLNVSYFSRVFYSLYELDVCYRVKCIYTSCAIDIGALITPQLFY